MIEVAPDKARQRREQAARDARVQRWAEDSGNAALMGRELPPAEVLAADQRITAWARQLKAAGLDGDMDVLPARDGPGFAFTATGQHGPPGGYGAWRLRTGGAGPDLLVPLETITTDPCGHRFQAKSHDPGVRLRHLSQVRYATCTSPGCRRPSTQADFEHNVPFEAGGRTCLYNGGPKCRHDHRVKQHPRWHVDQLPDGTFQWTTPCGRQYATEPTRYPT